MTTLNNIISIDDYFNRRKQNEKNENKSIGDVIDMSLFFTFLRDEIVKKNRNVAYNIVLNAIRRKGSNNGKK
jgi:hypothetical protein